MDTNKMREMREAFERTNSRDHRRQPPKGNNYIDPMAQADWESFQKGWQASREAVAVELPKFDDYPASMERDMRESLRSAIEAQGLKVAP
ncbi:hypothetical protein HMH05_03105 [Pseudomonas sp. SbB1]|uniref:Uncharacterized protein n=1 Tax=Pseudomonas putida (strain GB-1) TaxID=76869 RepID=B0KKM1_PSEPG|nr:MULTISPECIES: hypothetical protein [Pseudomonas]ABY99325.1 hypothetical protein PputGB1_3434 [Pseudomonas putida GB-1]MBP0706939.1 hypothetical protein [Pseudomonas sp. T34]MCK2186377.1 hypothetical protein [Pseudomonas sp. MB04B]MDD2083516.1 hypothetical protein [Pseudomonas putida]MDD2093582.1 hypothetical protein [Pseudomonas putida]